VLENHSKLNEKDDCKMKKVMYEKVIFRMEKFNDIDYIYAIFPDETNNNGYITVLPFYFEGKRTIFESHTDADRLWLICNTKLIKKKSVLAKRCLEEITKFYKSNSYYENDMPVFRVMEKIMR
jgi:hypothetical protein